MKTLFGYTRVSTVKQGEHGVSLQEQHDAIVRYCHRNGLEIAEWFEERVTAAKRGRPIFNRMLRLLKIGKSDGVIIHKIDRSARNLKDWADLGELIDQGIEVHFANESLDLNSRGGRLSADIQAVVAADFIRNLREETRKGFYGRLKQGLYPIPAPIGYLNKGKGKPKEPDPRSAHLVSRAFELYATGATNLESLGNQLYSLGLRNRRGGKVTRNGLSVMLNNPFYIGIIRLRKTGETFPGIHKPLIRKSLFDRVHLVMSGRLYARTRRHQFLFSRLLACKHCGYSLIGEEKKGHHYYRCHTKYCMRGCIREEVIDQQALETLALLRLTDQERHCIKMALGCLKVDWDQKKDEGINALNLRLSQLHDRLTRLTDAFIDRIIDQSIFEERKNGLLMERKDLEEKLDALKDNSHSIPDRLAEFFELASSSYLSYKIGIPEEKREMLKITTSNRTVNGKYVDFELSNPFDLIANRNKYSNSDPYRDVPRTMDKLIGNLTDWFNKNPQVSIQARSVDLY